MNNTTQRADVGAQLRPGVLKLSFCSLPARVYRGVQETDMVLPPEFLERTEGKFAGGVERAFMSRCDESGNLGALACRLAIVLHRLSL